MLSSIPTAPKTLESYRPLVGDEATDEILALAEPLKGARVVSVNSTPFGGGVAEILIFRAAGTSLPPLAGRPRRRTVDYQECNSLRVCHRLDAAIADLAPVQ
jgi:hypothetical protein